MGVVSRIKELADHRGWTRYALAKKADVSESTLKNIYVRGSIPSIPTLNMLCAAFGMSLSQFFAEDERYISLTPEQKDLLDIWVQLTDEQRANFLSLMTSIVQSK